MSNINQRALALLGMGHAPELVASAVGVSPSRISQLLSEDTFAEEVAKARYKNLAKVSTRIEAYENIEDKLLDKLEKSLSMIFDPIKLAVILGKISAAKPKATGLQDIPTAKADTVSLQIPTLILNQFRVTMNVHNQVISSVDESSGKTTDLVTMQSNQLDKFANSKSTAEIVSPSREFLGIPNEQSKPLLIERTD